MGFLRRQAMHLLSTKQVQSPDQLSNLFKEANFIRHDPWASGVDITFLARGFVLGIIKDEGSTRTRVSFEVAMKKLGGDTVLLELDENSSVSKGESIEDTVRTVSEYVNAIVMRHSKKGMVGHCSEFATVPMINAGDGDGEHPTQALLDAYTIYRETGSLDNLNIMIVGDLKCSRTVHSLIHLLSLYHGNIFHFISPKDMKLPKEYLPPKWNFFEEEDLSKALKNHGNKIDILYMTRLQKERYLSQNEIKRLYDEGHGNFKIINSNDYTPPSYYVLSDEDISNLGSKCKVLHPLPRNTEIPIKFDSDPRAAYFRQVKNGLYIRMALLTNLFNKKDFFAKSLTKV
jgi:aspartate carbamoyltransferase